MDKSKTYDLSAAKFWLDGYAFDVDGNLWSYKGKIPHKMTKSVRGGYSIHQHGSMAFTKREVEDILNSQQYLTWKEKQIAENGSEDQAENQTEDQPQNSIKATKGFIVIGAEFSVTFNLCTIYETEEEARIAAERLSITFKGVKYVVLEIKGSVISNDLVWE